MDQDKDKKRKKELAKKVGKDRITLTWVSRAGV
jgi:hypothetical protein